jgi:hypothetical protein
MCIRVELNQQKKGLFAACCRSMKSKRRSQELLINRLHPFARQRTSVLDLAIGKRMDHTARAELLLEFGILRVIDILWFLLRVEVIEITEEFIEPVLGRQELIFVAEVVLAKLSGGINERFEQFGFFASCAKELAVEAAKAMITDTAAIRLFS